MKQDNSFEALIYTQFIILSEGRLDVSAFPVRIGGFQERIPGEDAKRRDIESRIRQLAYEMQNVR